MLTLQHSLITLIILDGNIERFRQIIPYVLLPDAIRRYTGARQTSHFEENSNHSDISWMKYPLDIKAIDKESQAFKIKSHLANNIKPCCIGETTILTAFNKHNKHLPLIYYTGVKIHLTEDFIYDEFIREHIDCSDKYNNHFYINDKAYDDKGVRQAITEIEEDGIVILARHIYEKYNIITDQTWFDKNVRDVLFKVYSEDLAIGNYNYMQLRTDINEAIVSQNWESVKLNNTVSFGDYTRMYDKITGMLYDTQLDLKLKTYSVEEVIKSRGKTIAVDIRKSNGELQRIKIEQFKRALTTNRNIFVTNAKISNNHKLVITH